MAGGEAVSPGRVLISYAHGDPAHEEQVRKLWFFLRGKGIDAKLDLSADDERQDWAEWARREIRDAQYVTSSRQPSTSWGPRATPLPVRAVECGGRPPCCASWSTGTRMLRE